MVENPKQGDAVYFMDGKMMRFGRIEVVHENFCEVWCKQEYGLYLLEYGDMWMEKADLLKDTTEMINDVIEARKRFKHLGQ